MDIKLKSHDKLLDEIIRLNGEIAILTAGNKKLVEENKELREKILGKLLQLLPAKDPDKVSEKEE